MVLVYARQITARSVEKTGRPIATAVMQSARKYAKRQQKNIYKKIKNKKIKKNNKKERKGFQAKNTKNIP